MRRPLNFNSSAIGHIILGLGVLIRLWFWQAKNFANDTFALKAGIIVHSFSDLIRGPVGFGQSAPIGFSLLSKTIGLLTGYSDKALVIPSLLVGIVTLFLLRKCLLFARIEKTRNVFLLAFALHPSLVLYGTEFKPYAFDALVATMFLIATTRGVDTRRDIIRLSILCFLAPFFSAASFFVIPVSFAIMCGRRFVRDSTGSRQIGFRIKRTIRPLVVPALCACLAGVPAFLHLVLTMPSTMDDFWSQHFAPPPFSSTGFVWYMERIIRLFRGPVYFTFLPFEPSILQLLAFVLPASLFVAGARNGNSFVRISFTSTVLLFSLVVFASALHKWPLLCGTPNGCRLILFFIPSTTIVLATGAEQWCIRSKFASLFLTSFLCVTLVFFCRKLAFPKTLCSSESGTAVQTLVKNWKDDDVLVVDKRHRYVVIAEAWKWIKSNKPRIVHLEEVPSDPIPISSNDTFVLLHPYNAMLENYRERLILHAERTGLSVMEETNSPTILIHLSRPQP